MTIRKGSKWRRTKDLLCNTGYSELAGIVATIDFATRWRVTYFTADGIRVGYKRTEFLRDFEPVGEASDA